MKSLTNLLLGLAGGVVGLAAMSGAMKALSGVAHRGPDGLSRRPSSISVVGDHHAPGEPATEALARTLYEKATHRYPSDRLNRNGGQAIHYAYGLLMAAGYGLVRGRRGGVDLLGGLAFAFGLWTLGDLLAVPLLGLADSPTTIPVRRHGQDLGAHLAYGVATAATAQAVGKLI